MANNLFDIEPLILARIKALVPDLRTVASVSLLAGAADIAPYLPAAFVQPMEGELKSSAAQSISERQTWLVTVCVENFRDTETETTASKAGNHAHNIIAALNGWAPHGVGKLMQYEGRSAPYYEPGYGEFPLQFGFDVYVHGQG
ncbi:MAG: hypothetical protein ABIG70_02980 [Pseudomonadota bacterium]